jgi:hypothetical protein
VSGRDMNPARCTKCEAGTNSSVAGSTFCTPLPLSSSSSSLSSAPAWLLQLENATTRFSQHAECNETRTWKKILVQGNASQPGFVSGGLGGLTVLPAFAIWVCWPNHPCLSAVAASTADSMCFVYDQVMHVWHAWGLNSELNLCSK